MATAQPSCDICLNLHVTKSSSIWCSECEEAICQDCEQRHRIQKATKNHKTIPIEDYQELPLYITNIKLECEDHNQKLDFYCSFHNEPCCTRCVSVKHKDCRELTPLPEIVEGVKSSTAFCDLEDRVRDLSQVIDQMIKEKLDNKYNLEVQRKTIIAEVELVRKAINKHLDTIQAELLNTLREDEGRQEDNIVCLVGKLGQLKQNVDEIVTALEKAKLHASNFQTFLGVDNWTREIVNLERKIKSVQSDTGMSNVHLQIKMHPLLDMIEKDISKFGKLEVSFSPPTKLVLRKNKQSQQLYTPLPLPTSEIKLSKHRSFHISKEKSGCMITGCDMFEDGRIVVAYCSNVKKRLVVMNCEGSFVNKIKLEDRPFDVTVIDPNTVAVTLFAIKNICTVDVNSSKILWTISVNENCYGICFVDGKLVVSLANQVFQFVDLSGNVLSNVPKMDNASYCSVMKDNIYYAAQDNDVVYCCDMNGRVQWKFGCAKSYFPNGIANDASGNVFVTCREANKVIVIESSGTKSRELLTSDAGLKQPIAINYNRKSNILLICNIHGQCFIYKITN
ncbi:unnamed protein product [Mytilus coruscus]|uniref:B box-type domain-containing protein n=1 Tax=Mytilus coruscus TaxID=42192 RepID=A0A6J8BN30_MYTCO|nr:unnamed protein product [Mytilus coruscus]